MHTQKNVPYAVITYNVFYQTSFEGTDPLTQISFFDLQDVVLTLILIANDTKNRKNSNTHVNETFIHRLPAAKAFRLKRFISKDGIDNFFLTTPTVIAHIITDIYKLIPYNKPKFNADHPGFEEMLLDVILIYNERQYPEVGIGPKINSHDQIWRIMLMQDITGVSNVHYARTANIKHLLFIEFLRGSLGENFTTVENTFGKHTRLPSIYTFVLSFINLFVAIENKFKESGSSLIWFDKDTPTYQLLKNFQMIHDQNIATDTNFDISFYVTHPFFEHKDGKIYLVDHSHFAFALDKGWIYYFFKHSKIIDFLPQVNRFADFQSYLGKRYYEEYVILGLLKHLNKPNFRILRTDDTNLPDAAAIFNEKDVFLFEVKSSALHYKVNADQSASEFQRFIDENYSSDKKGGIQLFKSIKYLAGDNKHLYKLKHPVGKITVYPIIIYTEQHMEKHGVNDYVNQKFLKIIANYDSPFYDIKPLVMIHYDFFVENAILLEKYPRLLKDAIKEYLSFVNRKKATYKKTEHNLDYYKSMVSFDKFIIGFQKLYTMEQMSIFKNTARIFKLKGS